MKLTDPFPPHHLRWRLGNRPGGSPPKARVLCYIEKSHVERRLDEVYGPLGWTCSFTLRDRLCICTIAVHHQEAGEWISKQDGADMTDFLTKAEKMRDKLQEWDPVKAVFSDAFKRAGMKWGIGRYLNAVKLDSVQMLDGWGPDSAIVRWKDSTNKWWHMLRPELPTFAIPQEES